MCVCEGGRGAEREGRERERERERRERETLEGGELWELLYCYKIQGTDSQEL